MMSDRSAPAAATTLRVLPRGRHAAPREVVAESQRERLLVAMADAAAEKGYAHLAVADVIARAGVSRRTFYEQFANKDDCFLAAYDTGVEQMLTVIDAASQAEASDAIARLRAATDAYVQLLAANPSFTRTFLVEVLGAGQHALARRERVHRAFAELIAANHAQARERDPSLPEQPPYVFRALVGAIDELVLEHLVEHEAETLPDLLEALVDLQRRVLLPGED